MATNCCCWAWHDVTVAAWSLVFIHWIFCNHDTASVHIVTDNQRHSHRTQEGCFHISSTFWKDVCIRLFCWLVGWFEIQNTCFPVSFAFVMWLTSSLKSFNTYKMSKGWVYLFLSVTSLNVIGLFPGADQSDGMLVFEYCLHGHSRYVRDVCWCWKMTSWEGLQILRVY